MLTETAVRNVEAFFLRYDPQQKGKNVSAELPIETGWIQTFTGRKFSPFLATVDDIDIRDIAHSLSLLCRYTGHCRRFFSVAQHSVLVSYHVPAQDAMWALLHDAAEAYVNDLPRPIKQYLRSCGNHAYDEAESAIMSVVARRFGLPPEQPESVGRADILLLATEARDLMSPIHPDWHYCERNGYPVLPSRIEPLGPTLAESLFLIRFNELGGRL